MEGKGKKEKKKVPMLKKLGTGLVVLLIFLLAVRLFVPYYIENNLCARIADQLKVNSVHCEVRSFGITHLDISDISVGDIKEPFLKIDSMRINYSLIGLLFRDLESIAISGLELQAGFVSGRIYIPGLDIGSLGKGGMAAKKSSPRNLFPVTIGYCVIRNSELEISLDGRTQRIPFEMAMHYRRGASQDKKKSDYEMSLCLYPRGEPVRMWGGFDEKGTRAFCGMKTEDMTIARFQDLTDRLKGLKLSGSIGFESAFDTSGNIGFKVQVSDLDMQYGGLKFINATDRFGKEIPFVIQMGIKRDALPFRFNSFRMQAPLPVDFSMDDPGGEIKITDSGISVATEIKASIDKDYFNSRTRSSSLKLKESEYCTLLFDADLKKDTTWHMNFSALHDIRQTVDMEDDSQKITCSPMILSVSGDGNSHSGALSYVVRISDIKWIRKSGEPMVVPDFQVAGDFRFDSKAAPMLSGNTIVAVEKLTMGTINCGKIEAMLPFRWPLVPGEAEFDENMGTIKSGMISSGKSNFGYIDASISQSGDLAWSIGGVLHTVFEKFKIDFSGEAGLDKSGIIFYNLDFETPDGGKTKTSFDFEKLNPEFAGIMLEGSLQAKGKVTSEDGTIKTGAGISLTNSSLSIPGKDLKVEGLEMFLTIQDLLALKSLPKQPLRFSKLTAGNFQLESGEVEFQIESPKKYFVEKSGFSWCGGHVYSHAMRIVPGEDLEFILYCDHINLGKFLQQLKAADAVGDGNMNGRIPVTLGPGKTKIEKGFLYSTPGVNGIINLAKSDMIQTAFAAQQGVPMKDFALDMLKNFKYRWAKVSLNSEDADLHLLLQLSGVPADLFAYDAISDSFRRIDKNEGDVVKFQNVQYNINFELPFDSLVKLGNNLGKYIEGKALGR